MNNKKAIVIVRGDDTNFNGANFLTINLNTEILDLTTFSATFTLGNIIKTFSDLSSGSIELNFSSAETKNLPPVCYGVLKLVDENKKIATIESLIPFKVISVIDGNAIATEPYTLNFDVEQGGQTILNISVESAVTVEVGTTTTLPSGSDATVTNSGTLNHLILDFGIPQGEQGEAGQDGKDGKDGKDATINGVNTLTLTANYGLTLTQSGSTANISGKDITDVIDSISAVIPSQATEQNQLADKSWVVNQGYLTEITSIDVTNALGYTPYNSSNPSGYTSNVGTVTSVNNSTPDSSGNVALTIPTVNNASVTFTQGGSTKGTITLNQSADATIELDAGGGSTYTAGTGIDITSDTISIIQSGGDTAYVTKIGGVAENNGVLSNFSSSNYAQIDAPNLSTVNSFEIVFKFKRTGTSSSSQHIISASADAALAIIFISSSNTLGYSIGNSTGGANSWLFDRESSATLQLNTNYWAKIEFTGTQYLLKLSTDGQNYNTVDSYTSSQKPSYSSSYKCNIGVSRYAEKAFNGEIDLKDCYIKIDSSIWWVGYINSGVAKATNSLYGLTKYDNTNAASLLKAITGYNASTAQTLQHDASGNIYWG